MAKAGPRRMPPATVSKDPKPNRGSDWSGLPLNPDVAWAGR